MIKDLIVVVQQVVLIQIRFALKNVEILGPITIALMAMWSDQMAIAFFKRTVLGRHVSWEDLWVLRYISKRKKYALSLGEFLVYVYRV